MKNRTVEILAPAGSYESMVAAVNAGADAVYIGGSRFGARAYANNLDEETMVKAIDFMHLHGCRIYMTVNTLVKEKEMSDLYSYLKPYYEAGSADGAETGAGAHRPAVCLLTQSRTENMSIKRMKNIS